MNTNKQSQATKKANEALIAKAKKKYEHKVIKNVDGDNVECIKYIDRKNITVLFEDGVVRQVRPDAFMQGKIRHPSKLYTSDKKRKNAFKKINDYKAQWIGKTNINSHGCKMTIIEYYSSTNITVVFEDGTIKKNVSVDRFRKGTVKNPNFYKNKYIGKTNTNRLGLEMTIIDYRSSSDIDVLFTVDNVIVNSTIDSFLKGNIKHPTRALKKDIPYVDHEGRYFDNLELMCKAHNITVNTFIERDKKGWPIEKILTTPYDYNSAYKKCKDHLENEFDSIEKMCKYWNISVSTYRGRIKKGWSVEKALTTPVKRKVQPITYKGKTYDKLSDFIKKYNIPMERYYNGIKSGWSLDQIVQTPPKPRLLDIPINSTIITNQGFKVTCIENDKPQIKVIFEDGATKMVRRHYFQKGEITHPFIKAQGKNLCYNNIKGTKEFTFENKVYYNCQCLKCNWKHKKILTAQEFLQHGKECV